MFVRNGRVTGSVLHSAVPDTPNAEKPAPKAAAKKTATPAPAKKAATPAVEKPAAAPSEKAEKEVSASGNDNETR